MILRAARLGTTSFHTKTTTGRRIGPTGPCSGETIEDSTFARFSEFFDFRFLQHYLPGTDLRRSVTDFEIRDVAFCAIQQVMCDALGWKTCAHAGRKHNLTFVRHQSWVSLKYVDKLILFTVTMKQCGLTAGMQGREIDTEVLDAEYVTQRTLLAFQHPTKEWFWII